MKIINRIIEFINLKQTTDIDKIPMMRYPKEHEDERENFVNPFSKYNSRNSRIRYKRWLETLKVLNQKVYIPRVTNNVLYGR